MTGKETVMPWFPLPELMTTGISQPFIRASEPAEAYARAFSFAVALPPPSSRVPIAAPYCPRKPTSAMAVLSAI